MPELRVHQATELTVSLEVLPQIEAPSLEGLKLDKLTVKAQEAVSAAQARVQHLLARGGFAS